MTNSDEIESEVRREIIERIPAQWGRWIDCGPGWDWILADLNAKLKYLDFNYKINQVKEKYGTLRFYYEAQITKDVVRDLMDDAVTTAERLSASTCENCGNSSLCADMKRGIKYDPTAVLKSTNGKYGGWLKTICDTCAKDTSYRKIEEEDD